MSTKISRRKQRLEANERIKGNRVKKEKGVVENRKNRFVLELHIEYIDKIITIEEGIELSAVMIQDLIYSDLIKTMKINIHEEVEVDEDIGDLENFLYTPQIVEASYGQKTFVTFINMITEEDIDVLIKIISNTLEVNIVVRKDNRYKL